MVEFELEIRDDDVTVRVRASSKEEIMARLADARSILKKGASEVPKARKEAEPTPAKATRISGTTAPIVPAELVEYVEFGKDRIPKVSSKAFFDLSQIQAIALMLYVFDSPLLPKEITRILNGSWKRVSPNSIRDSLADKTKLRPYVIREEEGYRLTGQGKNWVKTDIVPKIAVHTKAG